MENSIYVGGHSEKAVQKTLVGIAHGANNLFKVVGGPIEITQICGIVKTEIQAASILINFNVNPTSPAGDTVFATDGTAMEINGDAVGTIYTWAGVVTTDMTPVTNGVALGLPSPRLLVPAGAIDLAAVNASGTAKTGDIDFYLRYKPLAPGAYVVPA